MAIDFDIQGTLDQMLGVAKKTFGENWKEAKGILQSFAESKKDRLKLLAQIALEGGLSKEQLKDQLEKEKDILEAELNACEALSKAVAQKAVNGMIDVFTQAVLKALHV